MKYRFYIENADGGYLLYSSNNVIEAIFTAYNYNADLWEVPIATTIKEIKNNFVNINARLLFSGQDAFCGQLPDKYLIYITCESFDEDGEPDGELIVIDMSTNKKCTLSNTNTKDLKYDY